jgi:HD superfamily phosphohydrolase YqeK
LLSELQRERRTHSREVGRKAASAAKLLAEDQRRDLYEAAVLHDIGYAHPVTGLPRS